MFSIKLHRLGRAIGLLALSLAAPLAAEEAPVAAGAPDAAMLEAWEKMAAPGPQHAQLKYFEGTWDEVSNVIMAPGAAPTTATGTSVAKAILGGRYIETVHNGSFMGQPHEGRGLAGYDNLSGQYTQVWIDNASTALYTATGSYDEGTKTYTFKGSMSDPMKPGSTVAVREVVRIDSPDQYTFEWYDTHEGQEIKSMWIVYKRK